MDSWNARRWERIPFHRQGRPRYPRKRLQQPCSVFHGFLVIFHGIPAVFHGIPAFREHKSQKRESLPARLRRKPGISAGTFQGIPIPFQEPLDSSRELFPGNSRAGFGSVGFPWNLLLEKLLTWEPRDLGIREKPEFRRWKERNSQSLWKLHIPRKIRFSKGVPWERKSSGSAELPKDFFHIFPPQIREFGWIFRFPFPLEKILDVPGDKTKIPVWIPKIPIPNPSWAGIPALQENGNGPGMLGSNPGMFGIQSWNVRDPSVLPSEQIPALDLPIPDPPEHPGWENSRCGKTPGMWEAPGAFPGNPGCSRFPAAPENPEPGSGSKESAPGSGTSRGIQNSGIFVGFRGFSWE